METTWPKCSNMGISACNREETVSCKFSNRKGLWIIKPHTGLFLVIYVEAWKLTGWASQLTTFLPELHALKSFLGLTPWTCGAHPDFRSLAVSYTERCLMCYCYSSSLCHVVVCSGAGGSSFDLLQVIRSLLGGPDDGILRFSFKSRSVVFLLFVCLYTCNGTSKLVTFECHVSPCEWNCSVLMATEKGRGSSLL